MRRWAGVMAVSVVVLGAVAGCSGSSAPASSAPASSAPASSAPASSAPAGGQAADLADAAYAVLDTQASTPLSEQLKKFADDPATAGIAAGLGLTLTLTPAPPKSTLEISAPGVLCTVEVDDKAKTKSSSCSG